MIEVNNLTGKKINKIFLKKIARIVLAKEKKEKLDLSIALVGQKRIKELNKEYGKKNKATDVLSFKYNSDSGEVVICPEKAKELNLVLVHGILHVLGYDHEKSAKQARIMEEKQNYYVKIASHYRS